jgi:hypothetical protein
VSKEDRKARIREYKEAVRPAGIFQVRNVTSGRVLIGAAVNPEGSLNRHRFELTTGSHPVTDLQADWNELGPDAFEFTVVDMLKPRKEPSDDPQKELDVLLELWRERLREAGVALYGSPG